MLSPPPNRLRSCCGPSARNNTVTVNWVVLACDHVKRDNVCKIDFVKTDFFHTKEPIPNVPGNARQEMDGERRWNKRRV